MTVIAATVALSRLVVVDPYQEYDFNCVLHRPNGQELAVRGSIRGGSSNRVASISGQSDALAYGAKLPVKVMLNDRELIDQEIFNVDRDDVRYHYVLGRAMPHEQGTIILTVDGVQVLAEEPIRISATGFCTTNHSEGPAE